MMGVGKEEFFEWTDERRELCFRLWDKGMSATQIADELSEGGKGPSRSAVLGKIHRRKVATGIGQARRRSRSTPKPPASDGVPKRRRRNAFTALADRNKHEQEQFEQDTAPRVKLIEPTGPRVSIIELNASTCRWPIGDVGDEDFGYCGVTPREGTPYCPYHAKIAYQPAYMRRRERNRQTNERSFR